MNPLAVSVGVTQTSGRRTLLLTLLICLIPVLLGGGLHFFGWRPARPASHGELIQPPRPLPIDALGGEAAARASGRWLLLIAGEAPCSDRCVALAEQTRNIRVALNRDMGRIVRIVVAAVPGEALSALQARQPDLIVVAPPDGWRAALVPGERHRLFVVDPAGNLMMQYAPDADAKGVHADLERLLKASWIG